jgi:hypothetical protein
MNRLILAALCAMLALPVLAAEQGSIADVTNMPESERNAAQNASQASGQTPADVDMANVRSAQPASGVPATPAKPAEAQPGEGQPGAQQPAGAQQAPEAEPKSSIPMDKRQGGDITQCLEAGDKSDKAIAACAEKYRPRARAR